MMIYPKKKQSLLRRYWKPLTAFCIIPSLSIALYCNHIKSKLDLRNNDLQELIKTLPDAPFVKSVEISEIKNTVSRIPDFEPLESMVPNENMSYEDIAQFCVSFSALNKQVDALDSMSYEDIIKTISHPVQARIAILGYKQRNKLPRKKETIREDSFKELHENKERFICPGGAIIPSTTLSDDGYRPLMLTMASPRSTLYESLRDITLDREVKYYAHVVFLYKENDKFGYVGINGISRPKFESIESLLNSISENIGIKYTRFQIYDMNDVTPDWITTDSNLVMKCSYQEVKGH